MMSFRRSMVAALATSVVVLAYAPALAGADTPVGAATCAAAIIVGTGGNDVLVGIAGPDVIRAGAGDDVVAAPDWPPTLPPDQCHTHAPEWGGNEAGWAPGSLNFRGQSNG